MKSLSEVLFFLWGAFIGCLWIIFVVLTVDAIFLALR